MAKTKADKEKWGSWVTGANHESKRWERELVRLPRRNRSALSVERKVPTGTERLSVNLDVCMRISVRMNRREMFGQLTSARPSADAVCNTHRVITDEICVFAYLNSELEPVRQLQTVRQKLRITSAITTGIDERLVAFGNSVGTHIEVKTGLGWGVVGRMGT
jgi:hypothetical protein